jgi:hypothetical protein
MSDEASCEQNEIGSIRGLGKRYQGESFLSKRSYSTREFLLARKQAKLDEIERIDKVLALLESMPNVEELLNLLPSVGL